MTKPIYTMEYRPVSSFTLPRGITTNWVRLPQDATPEMKRGYPQLERSEHRFGEFTTNRELTAQEMEQFQVKRVDPEHLRAEKLEAVGKKIETLQAEREIFSHDDEAVREIDAELEHANRERMLLAAASAPESVRTQSRNAAP